MQSQTTETSESELIDCVLPESNRLSDSPPYINLRESKGSQKYDSYPTSDEHVAFQQACAFPAPGHVIVEDAIDAAPERTKPEKKLALRESLGLSGSLISLGGIIVVLLSVSFLAFLWFGGGSSVEVQNAPWAWRAIALHGYTPQAITIVALIFRAVVVSQSTVCTSMISALIFEKSSVPKCKAASFSVARVTNNGPFGLLRLVLSLRNKRSIAAIESLLLFVLLLETIGLQLSSTILLSDLHDSAVLQEKTVTQLNTLVTRDQQHLTTDRHEYRQLESIFPVFGERQAKNTEPAQESGLSETGILSRAFLPMTQPDERLATRFYDGGAVVLNSNTACMRPEMRDFQFGVGVWEFSMKSMWGILNGTLDYHSSIKGASNGSCGSQDCPVIPFSCFLAGVFDGYGYQSSLCVLGGVGGNHWPPTVGPQEASISKPWVANSTIYLILATNMKETDWDTAAETGALSNEVVTSPESIHDYGEWRSYKLLPDRFFNASLCFQAYNLIYPRVRMSTDVPLFEPSISYDEDSGGINTLSIQRHFGAGLGLAAPSRRGILQIDQMSDITDAHDDRHNLTMSQIGERVYGELVTAPYSNYSTNLCYHCAFGEPFGIHKDLVAVLGNMFDSTARAVDMLQTYLTSIVTTCYYDSLKKFTAAENVTLASVETVITAHGCGARGGCSGFITVTSLLVVHIAVVLAITTRYTTQIRYSRYSNVWYAIAQLNSEELRDVMDSCSCSSDKDAECTMEEAGKDELVNIGRMLHSERVGICLTKRSDRVDAFPKPGTTARP
ncbi:hypothetical protein GGR57DRAFT_517998 [Xylariaceae sp. FL1272]|nr:hypothetical protein GGR57DRAFT_517998 [Xylariaceae sp. FL1272]